MEPNRTSFHDAGHGWDVFGLHPPTLARAIELAAPLYRRWFRVTAHGVEHVPATGPAILVANHAGALPIDAAMLCVDVVERTGRIPRVIAARFVPRLPVIGTALARLGAVVGSRRGSASRTAIGTGSTPGTSVTPSSRSATAPR